MSKLKIGAKIGALVGFILLAMGALGLTSVLFLRSISAELHEVTAEDLPLTESVTQITIHQLEQAVLFERALRLGERLAKHPEEKPLLEKLVKSFAKHGGMVDREFLEAEGIAARAVKTASSQASRKEFARVLKTLESLEKRHASYERHATALMGLLINGGAAEAGALAAKIEAEEDALDAAIEALVVEIENFTKASVAAAEADERTAFVVILILSMVSLLAGIALSVLVICGITRPLRATVGAMVGALSALAEGDTGVPVEVRTGDEMKELADAFEKLRHATIEAQRLSVIFRQRTTALAKANLNLKAEIKSRRAAQRALVKSEQRFKDFANTTSDWFWEMDDRLCFSHFSGQIAEITGIETDTILGKTRGEFANGDIGDPVWQRHLAAIQAHKPFREFVYPYDHPDGHIVHLSISGDPIFGPRGRFLGYRGTGTDISARVEVQEALSAEKQEAQKASRAKSEFLANMSHELRTPLSAIIGFSEMMGLETFGPLGSENYKTYAEDIQESGRHLLSLINDILDLSKIEAGKHQLIEVPVDTGSIVRTCLRVVNARAEEAGLRIGTRAAKGLPKVLCDERVLKQIVLNLLSNAVKFTPGPGKVSVVTKIRADGWFELTVADTGIGIAAEDIAKVLQPFAQADGTLSRKFEGTGLGLTLVKSLTERHGGKFEIDSVVGEGTTASVLLPPERVIAAERPTAPGLAEKIEVAYAVR